MKIVAAAGGSGGHCYPAIAFLQACKDRHPDWTLTLVVDRGAKTMGLELEASAANSVREVESAKFGGVRSLAQPAFWSRLLRGSRQARSLLRELQADAVVGFGGYGSFPIVWEAGSLRIPTVVHEQNAVMGMANRMLKGRVTRLAVSLELAEPPYRGQPERVVRTGFPLRASLRRLDRDSVRRRLGLDPAKKTLLVFGGSQGSRFINELIEDALKTHRARLEASWQILHLTGRAAAGTAERPDLVTGAYRRWAYSREMDALYTAADLVVSRAGSATLHELSHYAKPSLLIPYPYARAHQLQNARVLETAGAAWILEESRCSVDRLMGLLDEAAARPDTLERMAARAAQALKTDGAKALVDLVESLK